MSEFEGFEEPEDAEPAPLSNEEHQRLEESLAEVEAPVEAEEDKGMGFMLFEGKLLPVVNKCSWDEDTYVRHELAITAAQMKRWKLKDPIVKGENRMQRSERYLRWRYAGFRTGQVASL